MSPLNSRQPPQAFPTSDRLIVLRGDALDFGTVGSFSITRIAEHHAVFVESMQVTPRSRITPG